MPSEKTDKQLRYVTFLRGINVGGRRIIKNDDLKACFEGMKFHDVSIVRQSGNVIFSSSETSQTQLKIRIENGLQKRFDYPAKVIILEISSLRKIVDKYPFDRSENSRQHYVVFLADDLAAELIGNAEINRAIELAAPGDKVVYWMVQKGMTLKSNFGLLLSKAKYKDKNTVRNINTLTKIV